MQAVSTQPTRDLAATGNNNPHVPIQRSQSPSPFFGDCGEMPRVLASWLVPGGSTALVRRAGVTDSSGNVASQATREAGLTALPPELLKCIAGHLPLDWQRLSLALALPHSLAPVIRDEVLSGCIADLIPKAKTLASFRAILSMIRCLSPGLQAGFLLEAGFAIHQVAKNMQPQVIEEWLAQIAVLSGTGKIPDELRALARIAGHLTPEDAVDARENVQTVARFHGFPTGARTLDLELRAVLGSAGKAVQGGENVQVIAKLGGIVEAGAVRILEGEAVDVGVGSETPRNWQGHQPT